ncbi:hypothetical protein N431DRAFT_434826 [Stipitochalara longipes BDJ]|nr:hypothetical protein N431DRAFT_434826 [Stipitochalara longipes BDJ]
MVIQDEDDIAELVFERNISPHVKETDAGRPLTFKQYHDFVFQLRSTFTNRQLVTQTDLVELTPGDAEGRTGTVGHTQTFTALQNGKPVSVSSVSVAQVGWDEKKQRRQAVMESFVSKITTM